MVIIYLASSLIGGAASAALIGQHSLLLGLLAAPLGGSLTAGAAALWAARELPLKKADIPQGVLWC